jgi:hypothetical protein
MKKRGLTGLLFVLLLLPVFLMGCPATNEDDSDDKKPPVQPEPYTPVPIGNYSGTGTGAAEGFAKSQAYVLEHGHLGSDITVTVIMANGWMTDVQISGPDESPGLGAELVKNFGSMIKEKNSFALDELNVDGIAGATLTFNGIKEAGEKAIDQIKGSAVE